MPPPVAAATASCCGDKAAQVHNGYSTSNHQSGKSGQASADAALRAKGGARGGLARERHGATKPGVPLGSAGLCSARYE